MELLKEIITTFNLLRAWSPVWVRELCDVDFRLIPRRVPDLHST